MKPYYEADGITIYHGDCREILPALDGRWECTPAIIVTDPPYGMGRFKTDGKDYLESVGPALRLAFDLLKDGGSMFVFVSTGEVVRVAIAVDQPLRRMFWMYKPNDCTYPLNGWLLTSEAILWFSKGKRLNLKERKPFRHDCYLHTGVGQEGISGHPTVKPLVVVSDFVSRCPDGMLVLDPFCGSGTTLEAARNHRVRAIGIEIEERYCEIAAKRLAQGALAL